MQGEMAHLSGRLPGDPLPVQRLRNSGLQAHPPHGPEVYPGKQFGELLIGNYDLLEREREVPLQMSLNELMGEPINVEQILKERVTSCKKRPR